MIGISVSISVADIRRMFVEQLSERSGVDRDTVEAELRAEEARSHARHQGTDLHAVVRRVKLLSGVDILS